MAVQTSIWKRLLWLLVIWVAGVATLGLVAGVIRFWLSVVPAH